MNGFIVVLIVAGIFIIGFLLNQGETIKIDISNMEIVGLISNLKEMVPDIDESKMIIIKDVVNEAIETHGKEIGKAALTEFSVQGAMRFGISPSISRPVASYLLDEYVFTENEG